ncbi:MAG: sirohydrochlorin chelatase [Corynebacterium sp.]|nr:sirohydrochlorin chelatase [Corynebacterium sp.]
MSIPLITLSHGSRKPSAASGITALTAATGRMLGTEAVEAHLELADPSLDSAVAQLAAQGVTRAALVPLLFTNAFHNKIDVPEAVREAQDHHGVQLLVGPHLGTGVDVARVLINTLPHSLPAGAHLILYTVGSSDAAANVAAENLAWELSLLSGHTVDVAYATSGPGVGFGGAAVIEAACGHEDVHILPLFVTDGLLLDRVIDQVDHIAVATGARITYSTPLKTALAPLVAARYRAALSELLTAAHA